MIRIIIEIDGEVKVDQNINQMAHETVVEMRKFKAAQVAEKIVTEVIETAKKAQTTEKVKPGFKVSKKPKTCACGKEFIRTGNRQVKCRKDCPGVPAPKQSIDEVLAEIEENKKKPYEL